MDDQDVESSCRRLRRAADLLEELHRGTVGGRWHLSGLLASRPEIVARHLGGDSEHVAEARARSARWIATLNPSVAPPLIDWLRSTAEAAESGQVPASVLVAATAFAATVDPSDAR